MSNNTAERREWIVALQTLDSFKRPFQFGHRTIIPGDQWPRLIQLETAVVEAQEAAALAGDVDAARQLANAKSALELTIAFHNRTAEQQDRAAKGWFGHEQ